MSFIKGNVNTEVKDFEFIGDIAIEDFVKQYPTAGFFTYKRKNPTTFTDAKGNKKTLTDITFVKTVVTVDGKPTEGVTVAVVSSNYDPNKPSKIAIGCWSRPVVDKATGEERREVVTQNYLCNIGEGGKGEFEGMLAEIVK